MDNKIIKHHNRITESIFNFTELEFNAFVAVVYKLQQSNSTEITFDYNEIEKIVDSKDRSYSVFEKLIGSLQSKTLKIETSPGIKDFYSIFERSRFNANEKSVNVKLAETELIDENKEPIKDKNGDNIKIKDLIINVFKGEYTKYKVLEFTTLKSIYSKRLFQLCSQWKLNGKTKKYKIDELYELLNLSESLKIYKEFKRVVLDKAIKEINKNTSLQIGVELDNSGRKITHIQFFIEEKREIHEKIEIFNFSEDVENLYKLLPQIERLENRKKELAKLLKEHSYEYLEADIKNAKKKAKTDFWGYFIKSVKNGHYGKGEIEKKIKNKELEEIKNNSTEKFEKQFEQMINNPDKEKIEEFEVLWEKSLKNKAKGTKEENFKTWLKMELEEENNF